MKKLSKEDINKMNELKNSGLTYKEIAVQMNVSAPAVAYHLDEKRKQYTITRTRKRYEQIKDTEEFKSKNREYMRKYMSERYHSDEAFRRYVIEKNKENQRRKRHGSSS